jgi:hypothetical protein
MPELLAFVVVAAVAGASNCASAVYSWLSY